MSTPANMLIVARSQYAEINQKEAARQQLIHLAWAGDDALAVEARDIVGVVSGFCPCKLCELSRIQATEKQTFRRTVRKRV